MGQWFFVFDIFNYAWRTPSRPGELMTVAGWRGASQSPSPLVSCPLQSGRLISVTCISPRTTSPLILCPKALQWSEKAESQPNKTKITQYLHYAIKKHYPLHN